MKFSKNKIIQLMLLAFLCVGVYSCNNKKDESSEDAAKSQTDNTNRNDYNRVRDQYNVDKDTSVRKNRTKRYDNTKDTNNIK